MARDKVLVINCGSSSLKFALFKINQKTPLISGLAESLNSAQASVSMTPAFEAKQTNDLPNATHEHAIDYILSMLDKLYTLDDELVAVGHRVVHGGESFSQACVIDQNTYQAIEKCIPLAPLHNPANLKGINILQTTFADTPQVAVFDTAFHQTMPEFAFQYAIPRALYKEHSIRRYGFHGTSHQYVSEATSAYLGKPSNECSFVTAHLGNGASVCAIEAGKSVDTSMGMTPLDGLIMGTRSGDLDPGILTFLVSQGYAVQDIDDLLNKKSGLLGISELSNDMRTLEQAANDGSTLAQLAIDMFCFRLAKYIAAMRVSLSRCDGVIFTGGIGENSNTVRAKTIAYLKFMDLHIDATLNDAKLDDVALVSVDNTLPIFVSKTNEELLIATQSASLCTARA